MTTIAHVSDLLGGRKVLGRQLHSRLDLIPLLREGLPCDALASVTGGLNISQEVASSALRLGLRSHAHCKGSHRLDAQESERVVRLAEVGAHAMTTLGTADKAKQWLTTNNRALGGVTPLSLLDTDVGTRAVEDVLFRIEHGVHS